MNYASGPYGVVYEDNPLGDDDQTYTLAINDPTKLRANTWYFGSFGFSKHQDVSSATFEAQIQLVGNIRTLRDQYGDIYGRYSSFVRAEFGLWFISALKDIPIADGNDFFNLRAGKQAFYQKEFFQTGDRNVHDYVTPSSNKGPFFDFAPGYCGFGAEIPMMEKRR